MLSGESGHSLVFPARLGENHRDIAMRYLRELAPAQRQSVLDELEGRFRAEKKGMQPVYDAISFLHSLCKGTKQGTFQPNLGIQVRDERGSRENTATQCLPKRPMQPPRVTDEQRQRRKDVSRAEIAKMRKLLGMRTSTDNQDLSCES